MILEQGRMLALPHQKFKIILKKKNDKYTKKHTYILC